MADATNTDEFAEREESGLTALRHLARLLARQAARDVLAGNAPELFSQAVDGED